jgi:hypothetical protein
MEQPFPHKQKSEENGEDGGDDASLMKMHLKKQRIWLEQNKTASQNLLLKATKRQGKYNHL